MENLGYGLDFQGQNGYVPLFGNEFRTFDRGINLGTSPLLTADIGNFQGMPGYGYDNLWSDGSNIRIDGHKTQLLVIPWFHHGTETFSNNYCPLNSNGSSNVVSAFGFQSGYAEPVCDLELTNAQTRMAGFSDIVEDTAQYRSEYSKQEHFARQFGLYRYLKEDSTRVFTGDEQDDQYNAWLTEIAATNIGRYDSVFTLMQNKNYSEALSRLSQITDTCQQDIYLKQVLTIEIESHLNDSAYSSADTSVLFEIANIHSVVGGIAVKIARAMLNIEVEDQDATSSRVLLTKTIDSFFYQLSPVPCVEHISLLTNDPEILSIEISDITGKVLIKITNVDQPVDVSTLSEGLYQFCIRTISGNEKILKFIKIK